MVDSVPITPGPALGLGPTNRTAAINGNLKLCGVDTQTISVVIILFRLGSSLVSSPFRTTRQACHQQRCRKRPAPKTRTGVRSSCTMYHFDLRLFASFHPLYTENDTRNYAAAVFVVIVVVRPLLPRQFSFCWSYSSCLFVFGHLPAGDDTNHIAIFSHYERCRAVRPRTNENRKQKVSSSIGRRTTNWLLPFLLHVVHSFQEKKRAVAGRNTWCCRMSGKGKQIQ
jgi:hypothetical protein